MLPFLLKGKRLYPWVLSALTETAVTIPWLIFCYSIQNERRWPEALPGVWLLLLAYVAAGLWEAGAPAGAEGGAEDDRAARRRVVAMVVGLAGIYAIAYALMPPYFRPGSLLTPNMALCILPVAGYLWYQGAHSATDGIYYARVFQRFTWQGVALTAGIVMLFIVHTAREPRVQVLLAWSVPLLFAAGLALLVVTRERELRAAQARRGDDENGGGSSPAISGMILVLLGLTLAASSLLSMERLARIGAAIWSVIDVPVSWLGAVVLLIVYRWVQLGSLIVEPLFEWLVGLQRPQQPQQAVEDSGGAAQMKELAGPDAMQNALPYIKAALLIGLLILLVVALYKLNRRSRRGVGMEEERISLGFWASLLADLRGLFVRTTAAMAVAVAPAAEALDPWDPRALYRRLQAWGAARGRPRRPGETPTAYQAALADKQPGSTPRSLPLPRCTTRPGITRPRRHQMRSPGPPARSRGWIRPPESPVGNRQGPGAIPGPMRLMYCVYTPKPGYAAIPGRPAVVGSAEGTVATVVTGTAYSYTR